MKKVLGVLPLLALLGAMIPAHGQVINAANELEKKLQRFGQFTIVGQWNGQACLLVGFAPKEYLQVINDEGTLPNGISVGGPETVLAVGALGEDKKTFQNCNDTPSTASANFSVNVTKSLTLSFTSSFATMIAGNLNASVGSPGSASAAIGISGSRSWTASTTTGQMTSLAITMGNNYSTMVASRKELDITYRVVSKRVRLPISAAGVFDATINPCQESPQGKTRVSDLLSDSERTFTAAGNIDFDNVQEGTFTVSAPRPTQCTAPGLFIR
jgi:hypothetical protein